MGFKFAQAEEQCTVSSFHTILLSLRDRLSRMSTSVFLVVCVRRKVVVWGEEEGGKETKEEGEGGGKGEYK